MSEAIEAIGKDESARTIQSVYLNDAANVGEGQVPKPAVTSSVSPAPNVRVTHGEMNILSSLEKKTLERSDRLNEKLANDAPTPQLSDEDLNKLNANNFA